MCLCAKGRGDVPVGRGALRREVSGPPLPELAEAFGRRGTPAGPRRRVRGFPAACRPPSGSRGSARAARYGKNAFPPPPPRMVSTGRFGTRGGCQCTSDAATRLPPPSACGGCKAARTATGANTRELRAMIENVNRRDVLTKGSALIVAGGAMLSASPGKAQEESPELGFVRIDQARALYGPHADSPPFGLDATVFPEINLEFLHSKLKTPYEAEGDDLEGVPATHIVGAILQFSRQGGDWDIERIIRGRELPDDIGRELPDDILRKAETLLDFFPVPATNIVLAEYMGGSKIIYIDFNPRDVNGKAFFIGRDRDTLMLSPVILTDSECQCSFGDWALGFISRKFPEWFPWLFAR